MKLCEKKTNANFWKRQTWKIATAKRPDLNKRKLLLKTKTLICKIQTPIWRTTWFCKEPKSLTESTHLTVCVTRAGAGDGEAVQPEKWKGVGNCLRLPQNPQRRVHALLGMGLGNLRLCRRENRNLWTKFTLLFQADQESNLEKTKAITKKSGQKMTTKTETICPE